MHSEVSTALTEAINRSLPIVQKLVAQSSELHLIWRKSGDRQWSGGYEQRPSLRAVFTRGGTALDEIGAEFVGALERHYPEYRGLVGFRGLGQISLLHDPSYLLGSALVTLWDRHGTFEVGQDGIDAIVREFGDFVDQPTARLRFQAQLLNFRMPVESIELPAELKIRRLSEQEVSDIHGGPIVQLALAPYRGFGPHEFAIEGECEESKIFGDEKTDSSPAHNHVRSRLDRAILALRTFKEGRVGYDHIRYEGVKFCPLPLASYGYGDLYVPVGDYEVAHEEIEPLREHAAKIFGFSEPAMEMACSRLSDAQTRFRPYDRLVDAVIGLEALLLAGLSGEDRRGELKFRFALHYSSLFDTPNERHRAYRIAKDLYDLRSTVAHGGVLKDGNCRVGEERLTIDEAARLSCEVLRGVIDQFLSHTHSAPYKNPQYWERRYLGPIS